MEKFIEVHNNVLPSFFTDKIENMLVGDLPSIPHYYTSNVTYKANNSIERNYTPGFSSMLFAYDSSTNRPSVINPAVFFFFEILYRFAQYRNLNILGIDVIRSFIHLPSAFPGPDDVHIDQSLPHLVCLYYVNDSDGDTVLFKDDRKTEIKRVTPQKGKIVFFDGTIPHCSTRPSKSTRSIINFNFHADFITS